MKPRRFPWLAASIGAVGFLGFALAHFLTAFHLALWPCPFKTITGLPCATCGITRCGLALSEGHWRLAFHWHPVAALLILAAPLFAAGDLWLAWRGRPFPKLPDSLAVRLVVVGLYLGTWAMQVARGI